MSSSPEGKSEAGAKAQDESKEEPMPDSKLSPKPDSEQFDKGGVSDKPDEGKEADEGQGGKSGEAGEKGVNGGGENEKEEEVREGDDRRQGDEVEEGRDRKERKKEKKEKKDRKERKERRHRSRSRSVERHRDSRDRDRDRDERRRDKDRDRRDRDRDRRDRDRLRERERDYKRRTRSRSRSRDRRRRSPRRSRSYDDYRRGGRSRRSRSDSADYGGYVPRKRADTRRPPPDAPFSASIGVHNFNKAPSVTQQWPGSASIAPAPAVDPAEALRRLQEQQLKARQLVLQQQAASAAAAASKTQREVYVGNLAMGLVTEEVLRTLFNNTLRAAFPAECAGGMEPVVNVNMHSDGRYSFVEMRTPEMATEALKISGLNLLGMPISCGRPSGYVDPAVVAAQAAEAARALQLFQAGGPAPGTTPTMPSTSLPGPPSLPAGVTPPGPPAVAAGTAAPAPAPTLAPTPEVPTNVICVENMFTESVLMDNEEYVEVMQDLQDECSKMGNVTDVKVPKPPGAGMYGQGNYGKAFVAFSEPSQAAKAKDLLHGRSFDGQVLSVAYVAAVPT